MKYVFLLTCLFISSQGEAEIYRWVDDQGRVHFSDNAPAKTEKDGVQAESIDLKVPKAVENPELRQFYQENRKRLQALDKEREEERVRDLERAKKTEKRERFCARLKRQYNNNQNAGYLYQFDDKGDKTIFADQQREEYQSKLKKRIKKFCS